MDIFNFLTMLGGLALFLYGMNVMGDGLTRASGGRLEKIARRGCDGGDSVFIGDDRYGSRICKFRYHDVAASGRHYYGREHRYDDYVLDSEPVRTGR